MVCGADGVPKPTITWKKMGSGKIIGQVEEFHIMSTSENDSGGYTCTARNDLGADSRELTLRVQSKYLLTFATVKVLSDKDEKLEAPFQSMSPYSILTVWETNEPLWT